MNLTPERVERQPSLLLCFDTVRLVDLRVRRRDEKRRQAAEG